MSRSENLAFVPITWCLCLDGRMRSRRKSTRRWKQRRSGDEEEGEEEEEEAFFADSLNPEFHSSQPCLVFLHNAGYWL